jgi:hypothetical protein
MSAPRAIAANGIECKRNQHRSTHDFLTDQAVSLAQLSYNIGMTESPTSANSALSPKKLRRRWYQYRLRSLFLIMLLLGVGMIWFVPIKKRADRQRAVVEQIRKDGGWVFYDDEEFDSSGKHIPRSSRPGAWLRGLLGDDFFATVTNVHLTNAVVLGRLSDSTELLHLDLQNSNVSDRDLEQLSGLHQLNILSLDKTAITDEGIKRLMCLTNLKHLGLGHTKISDAGLEELKCLKQLKLLGLDSTNITDAGLRRIADMNQLECLVLNNTRITDAGLAHLTGLKQLNELCLDATAVSAAGLLKLRGLPKLKTVFAHKTGIGGAQLNERKSLNSLEWLCLTGAYFTEQDFTELKRALPRCYIQFDGF